MVESCCVLSSTLRNRLSMALTRLDVSWHRLKIVSRDILSVEEPGVALLDDEAESVILALTVDGELGTEPVQ